MKNVQECDNIFKREITKWKAQLNNLNNLTRNGDKQN